MMIQGKFPRSATAALLALVMALLFVLPPTASAAAYGDLEVAIPPGEDVALDDTGASGNTFSFDVVSNISGYYPFSFSLQISPYTGVSDISTTNRAVVTRYADDYYLVTLPENSASTVTITSKGGYAYVLNCSAPNGGTSTGAGAYAYLPAAGQFVNEGMDSGGWGDVYTSTGGLKHNNTVGVSLGFFGGYYVYDFGSNITNSDTNPYGADFIVYGNAFWGNSEPGCIQVAQDDGRGNPGTWYNIASSLYYSSSTTKNASVTYTNPTPGDDSSSTASTLANVPYTGTVSGTITTNSYHNHSWFPLKRNYFAPRTINSAACPAMNRLSSLPSFGSYTAGSGSTGAALTLNGVLLSNVSTSNTAGMFYGLCDVHPNSTLGGTAAYNPYAVSGQASSTWSSFVSSGGVGGTAASGGDPIDISWAVDSSGNPVYLNSIRYVRIYTGAAQMNGVFGEISTEVCGVAACTGTGSGASSATTTIQAGCNLRHLNTVTTTNMGTASVPLGGYSTAAVKVTSDADHIYINGSSVTSGSNVSYTLTSGVTQYVQVITQKGNESPYITLLKISN